MNLFEAFYSLLGPVLWGSWVDCYGAKDRRAGGLLARRHRVSVPHKMQLSEPLSTSMA